LRYYSFAAFPDQIEGGGAEGVVEGEEVEPGAQPGPPPEEPKEELKKAETTLETPRKRRPLCEECEQKKFANFWCKDCEQHFCTDCFEDLHKKGQRAKHEKEVVEEVIPAKSVMAPPPPPEDEPEKLCEECETDPRHPAKFYCTICKTVMCPECEAFLHSKGKRLTHIRTPLLPDGGIIDCILCDECEDDPRLPAVVSCGECEQRLCANHDADLHSKGKRILHQRQPENKMYFEWLDKCEENKKIEDEKQLQEAKLKEEEDNALKIFEENQRMLEQKEKEQSEAKQKKTTKKKMIMM